MLEIARYITVELEEPDAALRLLDEFNVRIAGLSEFPNRIALTPEEPWHTDGIHRMPVKNFLVYFWVDDSNLEVHVTAVVYGKRDQKSQILI